MGQKTRSNSLRYGYNQTWKSDIDVSNYTQSTLNNLFLYFSIKSELKKMKIFLFDFKIKTCNNTFKTIIYLVVYFKPKSTKKKYKWWFRFRRNLIKRKKIRLKNHLIFLKKNKMIGNKKTSFNFFNKSITSLNATKKKKWKIFNFFLRSKNQNLLKKILTKNLLKKKTSTLKKWKIYKKKHKIFLKKKKLAFKKHFRLKKIQYFLERKFQNNLKIKLFNSFNVLPKKIKLSIKKTLKNDNRFKKNNILKEFLKISNICLNFRKTDLLAEILADELQKAKKPNSVIRSLKTILIHQKKYFNITGIKIGIWGKFKKAGRSRNKNLKIGKLNFNSVAARTSETLVHCDTRYGVFGIKVTFIF